MVLNVRMPKNMKQSMYKADAGADGTSFYFNDKNVGHSVEYDVTLGGISNGTTQMHNRLDENRRSRYISFDNNDIEN